MTMPVEKPQPVDVVFFGSYAVNREEGNTIHDVASKLNKILRNHGAQSIAWQTQPFQSDALRVQVSAHFFKVAHPTRIVGDLNKVCPVESMDLFAFAIGETEASGALDMLNGPHIDRIYQWFRSNSTLRTVPKAIRPINTSQFRLLTGVRPIDDMMTSAIEHWLCVLLYLIKLRPGYLAASQENEIRQEHDRLGECVDKVFEKIRDWLDTTDRSVAVELEYVPQRYASYAVTTETAIHQAMKDLHRTIQVYRRQGDIAEIAKEYDATELTWQTGLADRQWVLPRLTPNSDRLLPAYDERSVSSTIMYLLEKNKQAADRFNWITGALSAIIIGLLSVSAPRVIEMGPTGIPGIFALLSLGGTAIVFLSLLLSYALPALFSRLTKVEASDPRALVPNNVTDQLVHLSKPERQKKYRTGADFAYALNELESPLVRCKLTAVDFQNGAEVVETAKRISISRFWVNVAICTMVVSLGFLVTSIVWHIFPPPTSVGPTLAGHGVVSITTTPTATLSNAPSQASSLDPPSAPPSSP